MTDAAERTDAPRPGTHHPHLARERALKVLFQADVRGVDPRALLTKIDAQHGALSLLDELEPDEEQVANDEALQIELTRRRRIPLDDYTRTLIEGVAVHTASIDALLGEVAKRWSVKRMPVVDRNLLRLAVYELAEQDTPPAVVIDEAVSLAGGFAGEKARPFINGILETVRKAVANGDVQLTPEVLAPTPAAAPVAAAAVADAVDDADAFVEMEEDPAAGVAWDAALDLLADLEPDDDEYAPMIPSEPESVTVVADIPEDALMDVPADLPGGLLENNMLVGGDVDAEDEVVEGAEDDEDLDDLGGLESLDGDGLFAAFGADADSPRDDEDEAQDTLW